MLKENNNYKVDNTKKKKKKKREGQAKRGIAKIELKKFGLSFSRQPNRKYLIKETVLLRRWSIIG